MAITDTEVPGNHEGAGDSGSEWVAPSEEATLAALTDEADPGLVAPGPEEVVRLRTAESTDSIPVPTEASPEPAESENKLSDEDVDFVRELGQALQAARTLDEIKTIATKLLSDPGKDGMDAYVKELPHKVVQTEKSAGVVGPVETTEGWFGQVPGDLRSELIMDKINEAKDLLDKRSAVRRAIDARSLKSEKKATEEKRKQAETSEEADRRAKLDEAHKAAIYDEAWADHDARAKDEAEDKMWDEAHTALAAFDRHREQEAVDDALMGPDSFEDFEKQELSNAVDPIREMIRQVQAKHRRLMSAVDRMPVLKRKDLEAAHAHELGVLYDQADVVLKEAREKIKADHESLVAGLSEQSTAIDAFENNLKADTYAYVPDANMHPEMSALIAGANGAMVAAHENPVTQDEYDIKHEKGHPTRIQRLVYRTDNPSLFVVEEWDKTSGKLKRQSFVKGTESKVLVTGRENGAGRFSSDRNNLELSDKVYEKLGPIDPKSVSGDSGTSAGDGYNSYVRNLTRAGGVGLAMAKELADPLKPKNKRTEGFIAMLTKSLANQARSTKK